MLSWTTISILLGTSTSDWSTVGLAVGPALIAATAAYLTARTQSASTIRQLEAEKERLQREHFEGERRNRQTTYHNFLALMYRLDQKLAGFEAGQMTIEEWLDSFQVHYGGIDLFGGHRVREPIARVKGIVDEIGSEAVSAGDPVDFELHFTQAYPSHRDELIAAVGDVIEAMREDILVEDPRTAKS